MRILIVGAGAVGGFFGAYLLHAQRDVTFLVRPRRATQLAAHGLELIAPTGNISIATPPTLTAQALSEIPQTFDLILLSSKAFDLPSVIEDIAPAVGPGTAILPLLNGLAHMATLDARFGREHILGGATTISTTMQAADPAQPVRILHLNPLDALQFGDRDNPAGRRMLAIEQALTVPGYTAERKPDITATMWHKWVTISTAATITCLLRATIGDIVASGNAAFVHQVLAETSSIAAAAGYPVSELYTQTTLAKFTLAGSLFTASMFRDIEAHNPIEAQQIFGDLLQHARRLQVPTPILDIAWIHLQCYEARHQREQTSA